MQQVYQIKRRIPPSDPKVCVVRDGRRQKIENEESLCTPPRNSTAVLICTGIRWKRTVQGSANGPLLMIFHYKPMSGITSCCLLLNSAVTKLFKVSPSPALSQRFSLPLAVSQGLPLGPWVLSLVPILTDQTWRR